jgi:hypothetical protein
MMTAVSHWVLLLASLLAPPAQCATAPQSFIDNASKDKHAWVRAIATGKPGWPRWVKPVVGPDNQLWMIDKDLTWYSADGIQWKFAKHDSAEGVKPGVGRVFFREHMWLLGGMKTWAEFTNDVWSSKDGIKWELINRNAPWEERRSHSVVVFNGSLWLIGGDKSSGRLDGLPTQSFRDVWNSPDGVNWTKVNTNTPWTSGEAIVFRNQLWVFGQGSSWFSNDGHHWKEGAKDLLCLKRRGHGLVAYAGKLWLFGGMPGDRMTNDVCSSDDGVRWIQEQPAPWFPRGGEYSAEFKDKLWIYGGKTGVDYKHADDVWYMK